MYDKHATWCQCALAFDTIFTVSIWSSFQIESWLIDIGWGTFFATTLLIRFCAAEHAPFFDIAVDNWVQMDTFVTSCVIACLVAFTVHPWLAIVPPVMEQTLHIRSVTLLPVITCLLWYEPPLLLLTACYTFTKLYQPDIIGQSMASAVQKQRFALQALAIVAESILLWHLRCSHRFPYILRWKPISTGLAACVVSIVYCHYYVATTSVSHNSIITKKGHGITASFIAAKQCPVCVGVLTSLDMESSFEEKNTIYMS